MQSGLYVALSAQVAIDRRLATIAANVANQSTPGYRAEEVQFSALVSRARDSPVAYSSQGATFISRRAGVPTKTDSPLDVAVQGEGWLALKSPNGAIYTRDGRMRLESNGSLVSINGYPVLDAGHAPIHLSADGGPPTIAQDGMITQDGQQIGAIGLFSLDFSSKLRRYDNSGVTSDKPATPILDFGKNGLEQGYVEGSNVEPILEMTKLIIASRNFEGISSATQDSETSLKDAIKTLGGA